MVSPLVKSTSATCFSSSDKAKGRHILQSIQPNTRNLIATIYYIRLHQYNMREKSGKTSNQSSRNFFNRIIILCDAVSQRSKGLQAYISPLIKPICETSIEFSSASHNSTSFNPAMSEIDQNTNQLIRSTALEKLIKNDFVTLVFLASGLKLTNFISGNYLNEAIKNIISSTPLAIQQSLTTFLLTYASELAKKTSQYASDRAEILKFVLGSGSKTPKKFENIIKYYTLKASFDQHQFKMSKEKISSITQIFKNIEEAASQSGNQHLYSSYNRTPSITRSASSATMSSNLISIPEKLKELQEIIEPYVDQVQAITLLSDFCNSDLYKKIEPEDQAVLKKVLENLIVPKRRIASSSNENISNQLSLESIAHHLGDKLQLTAAEIKSLDQMISFHKLKVDFENLKSSLKKANDEVSIIQKQYMDCNEKIQTISRENGTPSQQLIDQQKQIKNLLEQKTPQFPQDKVDLLEKLFIIANSVIQLKKANPFNLESFEKAPRFRGILSLSKDSITNCETLGNFISLTEVVNHIKKVMSIGLKPIKHLDLSSPTMKEELDSLLQVVPEQSRNYFHGLLASAKMLSNASIDGDILKIHSKSSLYIQGTPGTGKTTLVMNLAKKIGLDYLIISPNITQTEFIKKLEDCDSVNPIIIVDEAGEFLSKDDVLGSFLLQLIDHGISALEGTCNENLSVEFDLSRLIFIMMGNEDIKDPKVRSRTVTIKMDAVPAAVKESVSQKSYKLYFEGISSGILNHQALDQLKKVFNAHLNELTEITNDLRVVKSLVKHYANEQYRFFETELVEFDRDIPAKLAEWNTHFQSNLKDTLKSLASIDPSQKPTRANYSPIKLTRPAAISSIYSKHSPILMK